MTPNPHADDIGDRRRASGRESEWRQFARGYAIFAGVTATGCAALSIYLRDLWVMLGWLQFIVALPFLMSMVTVLWAIAGLPLLLLMAAISSRDKRPDDFDPDGPGVIVCR